MGEQSPRRWAKASGVSLKRGSVCWGQNENKLGKDTKQDEQWTRKIQVI